MKALALLAVALLPLQEPEEKIRIRCNGEICIVPQDVIEGLVAAHNDMAEEIARLRRLCPETNS